MRSTIFKTLRNLSQDDIAAMTTRDFYMRGASYFNDGRVIAFTWFKNDTELCALIRGSSTAYQILVRVNQNNDLEYVCNCPVWNDIFLCKHVICTLLTASNLLNDREIPGFGAALKVQLQGSNKNSPGLEETMVEVKPKNPIGLLLQANHHGSLIDYNFVLFMLDKNLSREEAFALVPAPYKPLFNMVYAPNTISLFIDLLTKEKMTLPLFVQIADKQYLEVSYKNNAIKQSVTELDYNDDDTITIKRFAVRVNRPNTGDFLQLDKNLFISATDKQIFTINDPINTWRWACEIEKQARRNQHTTQNADVPQISKTSSDAFPLMSNPITITATALNRSFKITDKTDDLFVFKCSKKTCELIVTTPSLVINGSIDAARQIISLKPQACIDDKIIALPLEISPSSYLASIKYNLPDWMSTKRRTPIVIKAAFELGSIAKEKDAKAFIKTVTDDLLADYKGAGSGGQRAANSAFLHFYKKISEGPSHQVLASNGKFYKAKLDNRYLWKTFSVLAKLFGGEYVSTATNDTVLFEIPLTVFYSSFTELEKVLTEHNIKLFLNNKIVKTAALDISVDASDKRADNGWFSTSSKILSQGIELSPEQRDVLFAGSGVIEDDDCIKILDAQTREILLLLAKLFALKGKSTEAQKNDIIEMPRLQILDLLELRKSGARVKFAPEDEQLVQSLTNVTKIEKISLPKKFNGTLREYQQDGYRWLAFMYKYRFGACLADDMGLGKTIQTIAFLGGIAEGIIASRCKTATPHLIIVPPTLIFNWQNEIQTFYPSLQIKVYAGINRTCDFNGFDVVLTTYDTVRIDIKNLAPISFHTIILDEAQAIKTIESGRAAAVRQLKGICTITLTGTPLENHIGEFYSIIDVALPGLLPKYKDFMSAAKQDELGGLVKKMNTFVLRRTKEKILKDLPDKVESDVLLEMSSRQQKIYATTVVEVKRAIDHAYSTKTGAQANIIALTAILRLRQICVSPRLIDAKDAADTPKIDCLKEKLEEIVAEGGAALVFSQFTSCLDLIEETLKAANLRFHRIDGSTPMGNRKKIVEAFQEPKHEVAILLLSLKVGGAGLNLTRANYIFHIDPWWNPAVENQASARAHRIGQKNTVFVTRLIMHDSIEEKMMKLKADKQALFISVMDGAESKKAQLISKKDFDHLLS